MLNFSKFVSLDNDKSIMVQVEQVFNCPLCGMMMTPDHLFNAYYYIDGVKQIGVCLRRCTHCHDTFFLQYDLDTVKLSVIAPKNFIPRTFEPALEEISSQFVKIYNQAASAEQSGLDEIAGMGYRRAVEFLIKDYAIYRNPDSKVAIEQMSLSNCISNKVTNLQIQACATGAVWLGNDFTHYQRRYEEYEIKDMKNFIESTVYWIYMELMTDQAREFRNSHAPQSRQSVSPPSSNTE